MINNFARAERIPPLVILTLPSGAEESKAEMLIPRPGDQYDR